MKLPDINFWLALAISSHEHHETACAWLEKQHLLTSIAGCRVTQQGYLRILTKNDLMRHYHLKPLTNAEAWEAWQDLLRDDRIFFHAEPEGLDKQWAQFGVRPMASSNLWMDAYLAAFAVTASMEMVTFDQGFKNFDGLKLELLSI